MREILRKVIDYFKDDNSLDKILDDWRKEIDENKEAVLKWIDDNWYEVVQTHTRLLGYWYTICKKWEYHICSRHSFEFFREKIREEKTI